MLIVLFTVSLFGCSNDVYMKHISKSIELCKNNNEIDYLNVFPNAVYIYCNNGASFHLTNTSTK